MNLLGIAAKECRWRRCYIDLTEIPGPSRFTLIAASGWMNRQQREPSTTFVKRPQCCAKSLAKGDCGSTMTSGSWWECREARRPRFEDFVGLTRRAALELAIGPCA